jgi:hypothetical protein
MSITQAIFCSSSGATASHHFVLETKVQGRFQGSPVVIKYHVPTKAVLQVCLLHLNSICSIFAVDSYLVFN